MRDLRFNMKLNKKAIIEDWIPLFVSLIIMVLIIVFFMAIKAGGGGDKAVLKGEEEINAYQNLITYLRTPLNDKTIADLILESYANKNYDELQRITKDIFDKEYEKSKSSWKIEFTTPSEEFNKINDLLKGKNIEECDKFSVWKFGVITKCDKKITAPITLPLPKGDMEIKLTVGFLK